MECGEMSIALRQSIIVLFQLTATLAKYPFSQVIQVQFIELIVEYLKVPRPYKKKKII